MTDSHSSCPLCKRESVLFWKRDVMTNKFKSVTIELRGCRQCQVGFTRWEEWEEYVSKFPIAMREIESSLEVPVSKIECFVQKGGIK